MNRPLSPIEVIVLAEARTPQRLGTAFGLVQLYSPFPDEASLLFVANAAFLSLYDRGLVRFAVGRVDEPPSGPAQQVLSRDEICEILDRARDPDTTTRFSDPVPYYVATEAGRLILERTPRDEIPHPSGMVQRPWAPLILGPDELDETETD